MRFFHLSDLHIGLRLYHYDLREEQHDMLKQVITAAERYRPEGVVIAGDIYDKAMPAAEAVELFSDFLTELTEVLPDGEIMVISGNHDSAERLDCFRRILKRQHVHMAGIPPETPESFLEKITVDDEYGRVNFYLMPFVRPSAVRSVFAGFLKEYESFSYDETVRRLIGREEINTDERNVLVSHQFYIPAGKSAEDMERADSEIRTVGNIDQVTADVLSPFDYCALGHLHKPVIAGDGRYRYSGSPLAYSVSEAGQEKGFLMVELKEKNIKPVLTWIPVAPFRKVIKVEGPVQEVIARGCDDYALVALTETKEEELIDYAERIRLAFPHLLEIVPAKQYETHYGEGESWKVPDPVEIFQELFPEMDKEDRELLWDVVNAVKGEGEE